VKCDTGFSTLIQKAWMLVAVLSALAPVFERENMKIQRVVSMQMVFVCLVWAPVRADDTSFTVPGPTGGPNTFATTCNADESYTVTNYYQSEGTMVEGVTAHVDPSGNVTNAATAKAITIPRPPTTVTGTVTTLGGANICITITQTDPFGNTQVWDVYKGPDWPITIVMWGSYDPWGNLVDAGWTPAKLIKTSGVPMPPPVTKSN
jgi:hypothetical protein